MFYRLALLFTVIPIVELALIIKVGEYIGILYTIMIIIITAVTGAWLAKLEGIRTWKRIKNDLSLGIMPGEEILNGAMILVAGGTLLTPGFLTDIFGLSLLFTPTRNLYKCLLKRRFRNRIETHYRRIE